MPLPTTDPTNPCPVMLLLRASPVSGTYSTPSPHPMPQASSSTFLTSHLSLARTSKQPFNTARSWGLSLAPGGTAHCPRRIFICNRGSKGSVKGNRPVRRARRIQPVAQMSWAGVCNGIGGEPGAGAGGTRSSGEAYGNEPGRNRRAGWVDGGLPTKAETLRGRDTLAPAWVLRRRGWP